MKYTIIIAGLCLLLPAVAGASFFDDDTSNPCVMGAGATFEPLFSSQNASVSPGIVAEIQSAKKSIRVASHDFLSKPVSEAIVKASRSHIDVKIVLNQKQSRSVYSAGGFFRAMSLQPHVTNDEDVLSSDYIIVDDRDVVLGNFAGFSDEDEEKKNAVSALIIHNAPEMAKRYLDNWQAVWTASKVMPDEKNN